LLADEVYAGAEVEGPETPSLFGGYERVMVTGSLSKAYGLPGLRLGWIAAPVSMREELWGRKDYLTITPSALSDAAAASVMRPDARDRILKRTREIIRSNLPLLRDWFDARSDMFAYTAPDAGAICYVRYLLDINSTDLAEQLRAEQSVLVVPGDHFGMDRYLRIGFGNPADDLEAGLERIADHLLRLRTA
jgi:aspartate/methionine/tyrosine aminotransferase